jgi:hypothetical protein
MINAERNILTEIIDIDTINKFIQSNLKINFGCLYEFLGLNEIISNF